MFITQFKTKIKATVKLVLPNAQHTFKPQGDMFWYT